MPGSIEFYYDFASPNAYFSSVQVPKLASEKNVDVDWRPVFLGGIMDELDTKPPAMQNELKSEYLFKDLMDWSDYYEIPFHFSDEFPINSLEALRGSLVIEDYSPASLDSYIHAVFESVWINNYDISNPEVIVNCLPAGSIEPKDFLERIKQDVIKKELEDRTNQAVDRGVFGCPTFFVEDEMFWGKDRNKFLRSALE